MKNHANAGETAIHAQKVQCFSWIFCVLSVMKGMDFSMEFKLNEQQEMIQTMARDYCLKVAPALQEKADEEGCICAETFKDICGAGFMGIPFDEAYGGLNMGWLTYVLALEQFSQHTHGLIGPLGPNTMFVCAVLKNGSEELINKYVPAAIAGDICGSFAFTEPDTGSDPKQLTTAYRLEGDSYVLNGAKRFITNAGYVGPIVTFAKNSESGDVSAFVFDKFCEGYSLSSRWELCGNDNSPIYDIFMDDIHVPKENILGSEGQGYTILKSVVALSKLSVTAGCIGSMGHAYDLAVKYAKEKMHRGKPITKFPTIQTKISNIAAMYHSAQLLVYHLAESADNPDVDPAALVAEAGMVKGYVADLAVECCAMAMTVLGAYSVTKEYEIERTMRTALFYPILEGAGDLQRIMCGSYLLKE